MVRIDSWESTSQYPNGHSVRVLGRAGELETEVQTILIENCIHVPPFSDAQVRRSLYFWDLTTRTTHEHISLLHITKNLVLCVFWLKKTSNFFVT